MTTIIVSYLTKRFRVEEVKTSRVNYTMNRRTYRIHQLRQELCVLTKKFKPATEDKKLLLVELRNIIQKKNVDSSVTKMLQD